jgi:hypothetical protein
MEKRMGAPQKIKNIITIWSSNPFMDRYTMEMKSTSQGDINTLILIVTFTIAKM